MIMRRMNITGLLVLLTLIPFYIPDLSAQTPEQRATLRGLKGFYVLIDDITQTGLTKDVLKTGLELKLRKAGIRVLTIDEMFLTPGTPHLYVIVDVIKISRQCGFVYSVMVFFSQDVTLSRNRSTKAKGATTWKLSSLGVTQNLRHVREVVSDLVDEFMNDYLAVNPK